MGIRQSLNNNPLLTSVMTGVIIAGAILVVFKQACSSPRGSNAMKREYFTVDDGANWFIDDATKLPPFDYGGKPAYRARVFRCPDGKEFVAYLERYSEPQRQQLQDAMDKMKGTPGTRMPPADDVEFNNAFEIKKPGDKEWIKLSAATPERIDEVMTPKCANGSTDGVQQVTPK